METTIDKQFKDAYQRASNLAEGEIAPDTMLRLYAYYKQAVKGDRISCNTNDDIRSAFKFNAWMQLKGMTEQDAKQAYIDLVNSIIK